MSFFNHDNEIFSASAPGRLDVMGGIADYSGSLLLPMTIAQTVTIYLQKRNDSILNLQSVITSKNIKKFEIDYHTLEVTDLAKAGKLIRSIPDGEWASYVIGCFLVLHKEKKLPLQGMNVHITSKIPWGKGVASSAALEIATMNAITKMYNFNLSETELPVLAQQVENKVVGAACGLMDQLSVHLGRKNKLLPLVCQPHQVLEPVSIPKGIFFSGIDSGIRHAVSGASYSDVRTAAFMSYSVIARHEGISEKELGKAKSKNDFSRLPYGGYLANISVSDFESKYAEIIPENFSGKEFIKKYGVSIDHATTIDLKKNYRLLSCARHPVYENFRVNLFNRLLQQFYKNSDREKNLQLLGELMFLSHDSYSSVGLGNEITDEIVNMVRKAGHGSNVYGARITGGGSGGTVVVLCYGKQGSQSVKNIFHEFKKKNTKKIFFFKGSTDGALILNHLTKSIVNYEHNIRQ